MGRSKQSEKTQARSMLQIVGELPNPEVRERLLNWISRVDFTQVESMADLKRIYRGALELALHVAPLGKNEAKACELVLKCISSFKDTYCVFVDREFPEELKGHVDEQMKQLLQAMEQTLPADQYCKIVRALGGVEGLEDRLHLQQ